MKIIYLSSKEIDCVTVVRWEAEFKREKIVGIKRLVYRIRGNQSEMN